MKQENLDLARGPIGSLLFKMSLPSTLAMLVMSLYNFVDVFWLSRVGSTAIAALTISFPIQMIFGAVGIGTGVGAGSFASRMLGAGRIDIARKTAGQAFFLTISFGVIAILFSLAYPEALLKFFGAHDHILELARDYLIVFVFSAPLMFFVSIASNLFRAEGKPRLSMYVIILSGVIGAILDPFFILGWGPFPALGVQGAALALLCSHLITASVSMYFFLTGRSQLRMAWRDFRPDPGVIRSIYQVGFPALVMNLTLCLVFAVFNHVLGRFGPEAIAALGLLFRITSVFTWILFGIGHGVMPLVGFSYGAHLFERLIAIVRKAVRASVLIGGISSVLLAVLARPIISALTADPVLISIAVPALRIYVSALVLIGPIVIWISMFNGLGKGFTSMFFLVTRDTVFLVPFLFAFPLWFGLTGVWWAQPVSNALVFILLLFRSRKEIQALEIRVQSSEFKVQSSKEEEFKRLAN